MTPVDHLDDRHRGQPDIVDRKDALLGAVAQDRAQFLLVGGAQLEHRRQPLARQAAQFHVGDMRRMPAHDMEADVVGDEGRKPRGPGRAVAGRALVPGRGELLHMLAHQREQQVFLGREIAVERGRLHADFGRRAGASRRPRSHAARSASPPPRGLPLRSFRRPIRWFAPCSSPSSCNNKTNVQLIQVELLTKSAAPATCLVLVKLVDSVHYIRTKG